MEIKQGKTPNSGNYKKGRTNVPAYIVIHYTGNNGDTAANNINYFANNKVGASAHFFVDENSVYTSVPVGDTAWHCGTSGTYYHKECRNANSIGIELCSRFDSSGSYFKDQTVENAAELTRQLMQRYNIPANHVVRHYDVTHKNCPEPFVKHPEQWENFKNKLEGEYIDMGKVEELEKRVEALEKPMIYNYIDSNMPEWAREAISKLVSAGILKGVNDAGDLGLTDSDLRYYTINYRAGAYDKALNR